MQGMNKWRRPSCAPLRCLRLMAKMAREVAQSVWSLGVAVGALSGSHWRRCHPPDPRKSSAPPASAMPLAPYVPGCSPLWASQTWEARPRVPLASQTHHWHDDRPSTARGRQQENENASAPSRHGVPRTDKEPTSGRPSCCRLQSRNPNAA